MDASCAAARSRPASETVLVAEDAPELRRMAVRILETLGYRVLEAKDGAEALAVLLAAEPPVDLVLADIAMPRLGGIELCERARAHDPRVAFLFCSGYGEDDIGSSISRLPHASVILKPYRIDVLASKIRELLDART